MHTATSHLSRRGRRLPAYASPLVIAVTFALGAPLGTTAAESPQQASKPRYTRAYLVRPTNTRAIQIRYRAHTGARRPAIVLVPRSYRPGDAPIPLVISPHGRGVSHETNAHRWGNLPGIGGFAVVNPAGQGARLQAYSWGARGQVADLAKMPDIVSSALPWLRIDRERIYAFGGSMGGQETLLLAARYPALLAGAAAIDSLVDFPRQYRNFPRLRCTPACQRAWGNPIGVALQELARTEVGGTPETALARYLARSPLSYARAGASSCLPLQIWWSRTDRIVVDSGAQSGALFRRIRRLNPHAPLTGYVGAWKHAKAFTPGRLLPLALANFGLMPAVFDASPTAVRVIPEPADACSKG
jgi:poly(3-hydroxybutyrate) depolymerase